MALLAQFLKADQVAALTDQQVEVLAQHIHTAAIRDVLTNQQLRGQITKELNPMFTVVQKAHPLVTRTSTPGR